MPYRKVTPFEHPLLMSYFNSSFMNKIRYDCHRAMELGKDSDYYKACVGLSQAIVAELGGVDGLAEGELPMLSSDDSVDTSALDAKIAELEAKVAAQEDELTLQDEELEKVRDELEALKPDPDADKKGEK